MKKLILSALAIAVVASTFTSCKKGEGDPGISFKSRKGRVAGTWKITSWEEKTTTNSSGNTSTEDMVATDAAFTVTTQSGGNTTVLSGTIQDHSISFEKKGAFEMKRNMTITSISFNGNSNPVTEGNTMTHSSKGTWNFLGKVDDYKNKERIVLNTTEEVENEWNYDWQDDKWTEYKITRKYANGENATIWHLNTLKGKEMVVDGDYDYSWSTTEPDVDPSSTKGTFKGTMAQ